MALLNNKELTTKSGLPIPTGSVISFHTEFNPRVNTMNINLFIWYSEKTFSDLSKSSLGESCIEIKEYSFKKDLTEEDFKALTPLAAHLYIKEYIESWDKSWKNQLTII